MKGVIKRLKTIGWNDIVSVENNAVVTNALRGVRLNKFDNVFSNYDIQKLYNYKKDDMTWEIYKPTSKIRVLHKTLSQWIYDSKFVFGKNIVNLPTVKTHVYITTTGAMKNAFGAKIP